MEEYVNILFMLSMCLLISLALFLFSFLAASKQYSWEKVSSYECGFQPFEDSRNKFDVKFYLVAILFIIFDLEISYLFPWALCLNQINYLGYISMLLFLIILTIGFIYEWMKGALDWD